MSTTEAMARSSLTITVRPGRLDAELAGVVVSVPHDAPGSGRGGA